MQPEFSYSYDDKHNPNLPVEYWFQHAEEGLTLFIVFYSKACRWSRCLGCNLSSKVTQKDVSYLHIMKQIDYIFDFVLKDRQK